MKKILLLFITLTLVSCTSNVEQLNKDALKYIRAENYTEGLNILNEALKEDPENDTTWNNISLCYDAIGEYQLALEAAQKAVNYGDENEIEYSNLGNAYFDLGLVEEAKLAYNKALDINPDYFYALYGMGIYYSETEDYNKALEYFENLYNNNPLNIGVVRYIAYSNYKLGKIDASIAFLEQELGKIKSNELEQLLELLYEFKKVNEQSTP